MKSRYILFDVMKAICVLYIVAFWHMLDYTSFALQKPSICENMTETVLAAFTFASGFFLGKKKVSFRDFYISRIQRFMLPLLASLIAFYLLGLIKSFRTVIFSATGFSCFISPMALTLWYFSMIILFYWITPFILWRTEKMESRYRFVNILVRSVLFYAIILCFGADERVQLYFWFYIIGILVNKDCIDTLLSLKPLYKWGGVIAWLLITCTDALTFLSSLIGVALLIFISNHITNHSSNKLITLLENISYSSMFAYLFHREFYAVARRVFNSPDGSIPVYGIIITILLVFLLSYYGQKVYDVMISRIKQLNKSA